MTGPDLPEPPLRGMAVEHAFGLAVLADQLERATADWRTLQADAERDPAARHLADGELSRLRAAADRLDAIAVAIAALPPAAGLTILQRGELAGRLRLAARNALTPDGARLPAPPAVVGDAVAEVRRVADALLGTPPVGAPAAPPAGAAAQPAPLPTPPTPPPSPTAAGGRACRVEVTATRLAFTPPCGCPPIVLARDVTEPLALTRLACRDCGRRWDVAMLGDPDDGLWVSWREPARPSRRRPRR